MNEHIISPEEVGNWSVYVGGKRVSFATITGCGRIAAKHVGRRVWRQAGAVFIESDIQFRMRSQQLAL